MDGNKNNVRKYRREIGINTFYKELSAMPSPRRERIISVLKLISEATDAYEVEMLWEAVSELRNIRKSVYKPVMNGISETSLKKVGEFYSKVGNNIRVLREGQNLSQVELARLAHMHQGHLSLIEKGTYIPTRKTIEKIAGALGVSSLALDSVSSKSSRQEYTERICRSDFGKRSGHTRVEKMPRKKRDVVTPSLPQVGLELLSHADQLVPRKNCAS